MHPRRLARLAVAGRQDGTLPRARWPLWPLRCREGSWPSARAPHEGLRKTSARCPCSQLSMDCSVGATAARAFVVGIDWASEASF